MTSPTVALFGRTRSARAVLRTQYRMHRRLGLSPLETRLTMSALLIVGAQAVR